ARHRFRATATAWLCHGRRPRTQPAADALHHAGGLPLSRSRPGLAEGQRPRSGSATRAVACGGGGVICADLVAYDEQAAPSSACLNAPCTRRLIQSPLVCFIAVGSAVHPPKPRD